MKYFATLVFWITISGIVYSQNEANIKGKITDKQTGEAIAYASIYVLNIQTGTTSNEHGKYELNVPAGQHKIKFSYMGYQTIEKDIKVKPGNNIINIDLNITAHKLEDVIITAKSEVRQIREKALPISVISMKEIQGTVSDVSEVLAKTAGIKVRTSGGLGSSSRISVRGLEGKRVGFFIDETPIGDNTDFIDINDIPVDLIERIEIYKGVVPAKFGGSAIGGAINIVLKDYPPRYFDVSYSLKSYNTHKFSSVFKRNIPEKKYEFGLGGFYSSSDNNYKMELPLQPGTEVKRDHDGFQKLAIGGSFTSKSWWFDEVQFEPVFIQTDKQIQGIEYNIQEAKTHAKAFVLSNHLDKDDFLSAGLDFNCDNIFTYTQYSHVDKAMNRYNWNGDLLPPVTEFGGEEGKQPNDSYDQKKTFFQKLNLNYLLDERNAINLNSNFKVANNNPKDTLKEKVIGYKTDYKSSMTSWILGLSHEFNSLDQKFTNIFSVKYYLYTMQTTLTDLYSQGFHEPVNLTKNNFGTSNALRYRFTPQFLAKASFAYDVRLPSENELLGDGFIISPAGNLEPEYNRSINIGVMYDKRYFSNYHIQVEFNAFYMHLENMIRFVGGPLQSVYQNFGEMQTLGLEAEVKWDATSFLYLWANVTYQDLRDIREYDPGSNIPNPTKNQRMPNIPYFYANGGFELHKENFFGGNGQNTRLFADCSFIEEYFYDFEQSIYQERRIPRTMVYNAGFEQSFDNQSIFFSFQMNNITNEKVISEFNRPLTGRNFGVKVRYIFK